VLVEPRADCHRVRQRIEHILHGTHGIDHTTLQVDHLALDPQAHCADPHGVTFRR
jgi:cobalt-zinc-cadmium efflux system protein